MIKLITIVALAGASAGAAAPPHAANTMASHSANPTASHAATPMAPHADNTPAQHEESGSSSSAAFPASPPVGRIPGFAAWLADQPIEGGAETWHAISDAAAWKAIAAAGVGDRQAARWAYAKSLIATARGADALGVLNVMLADDPDLALVAAWQRAHGVAQVQARHLVDAVASLRQPLLVVDAEACLWRMRALSEHGDAAAALGSLNCAVPALQARRGAARRPFILAAARAATAAGRYQVVGQWLAGLPDGDTAANVLRGKVALALGKAQEGRLLLARVDLSGTPEERAEARLAMIEQGVATKSVPPAESVKQLDRLLIGWRGDEIERRALFLSMRLGGEQHDPTRELAAGAILARYFNLGAGAGQLVETLRDRLTVLLAANSKLPLAQAVGLFWDYRDFAPGGIDGLNLSEKLVARLQSAGLYGRAADLLDRRLDTATTQDVEQGPLSIRIAGLRILAGDPTAAVRVLRRTQGVSYPKDMLAQRHQLEAVGLTLLGKSREALAVLDEMPNGAAMRAEIYWRARDWAHLEAVGEDLLPPPGRLGEVGQAIVLRQAITSAMLGHSDALAQLHRRYASGFAGLPSAAAFEVLAGKPDTLDPTAVSRAMAAMPTASPIGALGDMMDAGEMAMMTRN